MNKKEILVTGGRGFIGTNFVNYYAKRFCDTKIHVVDYGGIGSNEKQMHENVIYYDIDICNKIELQNIFKNNDIKTIFHFAAESHVDRSINTAIPFIQSNIIGTFTLLECALDSWKENLSSNLFVHISTDEVYGSLKEYEDSFNEDSQYKPNSPYSASKASSDHLVRAWSKTYGLKCIVTNCSNNFGPFQNHEKMLPKIINALLAGNKVPVYGDGRNIRDWLYVHDHVKALTELSLISSFENYTKLNIGGGVEMNNLQLINSILKILSSQFLENKLLKIKFPHSNIARLKNLEDHFEFVEDRKGHDFRYSIDCSSLEKVLPSYSPTSFEKALHSTIDWYISEAENIQ